MKEKGDDTLDKEGLTGKVVWPIDPEYSRDRLIYNRAINKYPAVIVYCYNNQDVSNAILWARKNRVKLRIRSGGHNYEGYCIGTAKLVIDTTPMNKVEIDEAQGTVKIQAGARLKKVYELLYQKGYAFAGGTCPTVAISGLVMGGGIGLSARLLGLTTDHLIEAEMVDAQGRVLTANQNSNPDLFWALRGAGGGNFGVVTSYTFRLQKRVDKITLFQLEWGNRPARYRFLSTWQSWLENLDRRVSAFGRTYKEGATLFGFFYGTPEAARKILEPMLEIPGIIFENIEYVDFIDAVNTIGSLYPKSDKFVDTGRFVYKHLSKEELCSLVSLLDKAPTGYDSLIKVYSMGGAVQDTGINETAFYYRKARYIMAISGSWEDIPEALAQKNWVARGFQYIKSITKGSYVNFPYDRLPDYQTAYYGAHVKALQKIKRKYDPQDVFSFPQSITPI